MALYPDFPDPAIRFYKCVPGRCKPAGKVADIFGNDTMTIIEINVGGKNR